MSPVGDYVKKAADKYQGHTFVLPPESEGEEPRRVRVDVLPRY